jgi:multidrug resistance efflux pump
VKRRRLLWLSVAVIVILSAAVAVGTVRSRISTLAETGPVVPTARVERGSMDLAVHMVGELRALRQQTILAPAVGGALRILDMVEVGEAVTSGDVIVEFDPADQLYALEQAESELLEAEQEIIKRRADTEAQNAQDKVAILNAEADLRRAELDASIAADLIPANDHKIRQAALGEAQRALAQVKDDVQARAAVNKAGLSVLEEKRVKAKLTADRARQNIDSLVVKSPIDGVATIRENFDTMGGIIFGGMSMPPYAVGDTVNPGRQVLDVFDVSGMEIRAMVNEQDRSNLSPGQSVTVTSDAVPGRTLSAKVKNISGLGRADRRAGPLRQFEVTMQLDRPDPALLPGTSVDLVSTGQKLDNALVLPRQTVFEQDGKPIVYVRAGDLFEAKPVKILNRTESRVSIEGIEEGTEVALVNPEAAASLATGARKPPAPQTPPAPPAGGPR